MSEGPVISTVMWPVPETVKDNIPVGHGVEEQSNPDIGTKPVQSPEERVLDLLSPRLTYTVASSPKIYPILVSSQQSFPTVPAPDTAPPLLIDGIEYTGDSLPESDSPPPDQPEEVESPEGLAAEQGTSSGNVTGDPNEEEDNHEEEEEEEELQQPGDEQEDQEQEQEQEEMTRTMTPQGKAVQRDNRFDFFFILLPVLCLIISYCNMPSQQQ